MSEVEIGTLVTQVNYIVCTRYIVEIVFIISDSQGETLGVSARRETQPPSQGQTNTASWPFYIVLRGACFTINLAQI